MATLRRLDDHNAEPRPVIGDPLTNALANLRWSTERGEWSAAIRPDECQALLDHIAGLEERAEDEDTATPEEVARFIELASSYTEVTTHAAAERWDAAVRSHVQDDTVRVHTDTARTQATEADRDALLTLAAAGATGAMLGIIAAALRLP